MKRLWKEIWKNRAIYILLLPGLLWMFIFAYMPMGGLSLAFKSFNARLGIWKSPWAGMENFHYLFRDPSFVRAVTMRRSMCWIQGISGAGCSNSWRNMNRLNECVEDSWN